MFLARIPVSPVDLLSLGLDWAKTGEQLYRKSDIDSQMKRNFEDNVWTTRISGPFVCKDWRDYSSELHIN